mgnify:CR=1 FL=1
MSRRLRGLLAAGVALLLLVTAGAAAVVWRNTYDLREERVVIPDGPRSLDGVLALPAAGRGPYGLVVFVHGDGPVDATHDGFYRPIWEAFAHAGYASLSWNKPGVAGSKGDWLGQSMEDRAREVTAAVAWARARPGLDGHRIGLWGASQAGWVMPKVAARTPDLRFVIAVSPAINWLRQGRYNLLAELGAEGASPATVQARLERSETTRSLLRRGATFEEYRAEVGDTGDMTEARWGFILRNHTVDATEDLSRVRVPTLLVLAGHDLNVDVADTEAVYRASPAPLWVRRYPGADHALLREEVAGSEIRTVLTALFAPRDLFADGFLADQAGFLRREIG